MTDCNSGPCRDWVITLAQDGSMTVWGWAAIVILSLGLCAITLAAIMLWDRMS
jgi:hypothetical protein